MRETGRINRGTEGRNADMEIRPMTQEEQLYADRQSMQIQGQTGSIGQLMVDFGESGTGYDSA